MLKKSGIRQQAMADLIEVSQSRISRELARNTGLRCYHRAQAQRQTIERLLATAKPRKMTAALFDEIEDKLFIK